MENKKINVLLIEDSVDDAELIKRTLEKAVNARFSITSVKKLQDGLEYMDKNKPDLVLSDLGLPDSHGLDTVTKILLAEPHIPLVVLSGFDDEAVAIKAVQSGAQDYLVKGQFESFQLERSLYYSIERARLQSELEQEAQEISSIHGNLLKILEKNADAIVVVSQDKRILFTNPAVVTLLGRKQKELQNQPFEYPLNTGKTTEIEITRQSKEKNIAEMNVVEIDWEGEPAYVVSLHNVTKRKQAEEALRISEDKFSKAFLNSPEVIVISDIENGTILEANDTFLRLTGYTREEVVGKKSSELGLWAIPEERAAVIRKLQEKEIVSNEECRFRMKSGEIRIWLFSAEIINIDNKPCMLSVTIDITERKKVEEALRFSDAAFRSIHESVIATDTKYVITHWNEISERMYGIKASSATGKKLMDIIEIEENLPDENDRRLKKLEADGYYREEQLHRTKYGEVWVDVSVQGIEENGKRYGWVMLASAITQRKLAEEALKRSEEKYRELINTSTDGIVSADAQMRFIVWNLGAEKIFGFKEKEMLGQSIMKIIPKSAQKDAARGFARINKAGSVKGNANILEFYGLKKDGSQVPVEISVSARKLEDNYISTAIIRDITERKLAEEKLRESEERYRDLFENASDLIQSCTMEGKCIYVNKAWRDALGYSEKEVLNLNFWDIIHPDYLVRCKQTLQRVTSGETINNIETVFVAKDGRLIQVEGNINPVRKEEKVVAIRAIFRDITERKEANKKLLESEERYRDLFENANDLIQSVSLDGHFVYVNKAWRDALGYTDKEVEKLTLWDIIHPDSLQHCEKVFQKVIQGQTQFVETAFVAKDGKVIFVEGNANLYSGANKVMATRGIFRDITERKLAEEKMRKIDQMKTEFLSNVSHELRTPLQSISGFTKLIMNGQVPDPATQQEFFQIIDRETMHLGNLINSLLDMSRLESGRFQIFRKLIPVHETIVDSIKMFRTLAREKNIILTENMPPQIPEMEVDNERLRQVIINLLSNAIKFSDPGGSIHVNVEIRDSQLLFQVIDHGTGIREQAMQHLFERFYRAEGETARGGTGLGLYISKQIIEAHGGRIWAESKFGEGSTFSFTLPLDFKGGNGNGKENSGNRRRPGDIKTRRLLSKA
jgi:PAS domain S-box-containing protein